MRDKPRLNKQLKKWGLNRFLTLTNLIILIIILSIGSATAAIIVFHNNPKPNKIDVTNPAPSSSNDGSSSIPLTSNQPAPTSVSGTSSAPGTSQKTTSNDTSTPAPATTFPPVDKCYGAPQLTSLYSNSISKMRSDDVNAVIDFANNGGYSNNLINTYIVQANQLLQKSYNQYLQQMQDMGCPPGFSVPTPLPAYPWS